MISSSLHLYIEQYLQELQGSSTNIQQIEPISGGSVNEAYSIHTSADKYFLKLNTSKNALSMFQQEAEGLAVLSKATDLLVPQVLLSQKVDNAAFLLMEFVDAAAKSPHFWEDFGRGLAHLHRQSSDEGFGWKNNNYIGILQQENAWQSNWADFFIANRLMVQEKMAREQGLIDESVSKMLSKLYAKMDQIFPKERPSLLHGDLWSGNFLADSKGNPALIDPAVYYGHREMDVAMSLLFGGFQKEFYRAYQESWPLEKAWERRVDICNLYPLLVHVNLFGSSYASRLKSLLKQLLE